jgi:hypothetical protein
MSPGPTPDVPEAVSMSRHGNLEKPPLEVYVFRRIAEQASGEQ